MFALQEHSGPLVASNYKCKMDQIFEPFSEYLNFKKYLPVSIIRILNQKNLHCVVCVLQSYSLYKGLLRDYPHSGYIVVSAPAVIIHDKTLPS